MSALLFLIPGLVALYLLVRGRIETAFLSVYLPALLFLPDVYALKLPHFPQISAAQSALIPLGAVAIYRLVRRGLPSLMDILVFLFIISISASEVFRENVMNDGILAAAVSFISIFLAYAVGRTLIEPDLRFVTVRRFVVLILLLGPLGLYEWRMGQSPYDIVGQKLFNVSMQGVQLRSGYGRMAASFNDTELAGTVFGITAALNAWLVYLYEWRSVNLGKVLTWLEKYHIAGLLLLLFIAMTQSRGPMLAVAVAYLILQIPRFRNRKTASIAVAILVGVAMVGVYLYFMQYTSISDPFSIANEQQGSAYYRRQMIELYQPVAQQGGWLGWGALNRPVIGGMFSIDNEYLLVHLCYGMSGYILFLLITMESLRSLIVKASRLQERNDQTFAIALLAAMVMFWISFATVYMGEQTPQIAFMLIGWSQSIKPGTPELMVAPMEGMRQKFSFRHILR